MDEGVSPLLKGNGMEVDEDVEEIGRNLPRDKTNNHQRRIATNPEPNQHLSVRNTNRFKTLPTGSNGKGHKTRQPDRGNRLKNLLVVNLSNRGRIVELMRFKPNVTAEEGGDLRFLLDSKRKEKVEGVQDLRSFFDSRRRGKFPHSNKPPEYL
jgi:hypothetical protein